MREEPGVDFSCAVITFHSHTPYFDVFLIQTFSVDTSKSIDDLVRYSAKPSGVRRASVYAYSLLYR